MRIVLLFISILISALLTGCTHAELLGQKRTSVCTIRVSTSPDFTNSMFTDEIVVAADENGNAVFSEQKGAGAVITYLSPADQNEVRDMLHTSLELGNAADKEKADVQKSLGRLRQQNGTYGWPTDLLVQFHASSTGTIWNTGFDVCRMMPDAFKTGAQAKTEPCYEKTGLYLNSLSVTKLLNCLDLISFPAKNVSASSGGSQAIVSFSAPVSGDRNAISGYTVTSNPSGGIDGNAGSKALTHTVTGLKNGTSYTFTVQVANAAGIGPASPPSNSVTPVDVPETPANVTATSGNAQADVSFSAPLSDGGNVITGYTVTSNPPDGIDSNAGSPALTHTVTGLKNGTAYTFSVQADNFSGTSSASSPSNSVTPFPLPGVPTNVTATAGTAQAKISFLAPASGDGFAITGYTVSSKPSGGTDTDAGSPALTHTVTGLKNGTAYTFTVKATNAVKTGPASIPSNSVTPADVPGTPTNVTATAGRNARAKVTFTAPVSDGGSAITGYTVTSSPSGGIDGNAGSLDTTHTITGLKNGTTYSFSVQAENAAGSGPASLPTNKITPDDVPGAPVNVTATAGNARAKVSFSAPESDGGHAITGYTVTSNPSGGIDVNAGSRAMTRTIFGLKNDTAYTFSIKATNPIGISPASSPSNTVIPLDVPGAPVSVTATPGNSQATVRFSAPKSDGGSAITGYTVISSPSDGTDINAGSTALTHTVTGLKNGTPYTFSVQASKAAGTGPASTSSNSVIPADVPGAPTNVTATASSSALAKVSFSAPVSDGGSVITGYVVTSNPAGGSDVNVGSAATTHTIVGLNNGTAYTFSVQAVNVAGTGPASTPSNRMIAVDPEKSGGRAIEKLVK